MTKTIKELKKELRLAKINGLYHQKQMEYFKGEVQLLEDALNDLL